MITVMMRVIDKALPESDEDYEQYHTFHGEDLGILQDVMEKWLAPRLSIIPLEYTSPINADGSPYRGDEGYDDPFYA